VRIEELASLLSDVQRAEGVRYGARDQDGRPLDCLKVQQVEPGGYLGVSHLQRGGRFSTFLSESDDLLTWRFVRRLAEDASQPTLEPDGAGGWLLADEVMRSKDGNTLRFQRFSSTQALREGRPDRVCEPSNTLARRGAAQGTPHLFAIDLSDGIDRSTIGVGFHYFDGVRDRQAEGTLRGFSRWTAEARPDLDALFPDARGNVGDRDAFTVAGRTYVVHEAQGAVGDWGSWRVFLRDPADDRVVPMPIRSPGGSPSVGNPTVTAVTLPDGRPGLFATYFVFSPGGRTEGSGALLVAIALP
jgi:hypothetical protein